MRSAYRFRRLLAGGRVTHGLGANHVGSWYVRCLSCLTTMRQAFPMRVHSGSAYRRLLVVAMVAATAAIFACRPAWSPDSSRVIYPGRVDGKLALAQYNVETGTNKIVLVTPAPKVQAQSQYLGSDELVILSTSKDQDNTLLVSRLPLGDAVGRRVPGPFKVATKGDPKDHMILPPVVVNGHLFLGGKSLTRVDLETGKAVYSDLPSGVSEVVLSRRGEGLCYVTTSRGDQRHQWELGTIDPVSLSAKVLFEAPQPTDTDLGWAILPMPSFTEDLKRVALPGARVKKEASDAAEVAILVFHDGKLENVLPLGESSSDVVAGSVAWAPDNVSLFALIARTKASGLEFSLYEGLFSGSVSRETKLLAAKMPTNTPSDLAAMQMQLALSPNGKWVAVTSSYVIDDVGQEKALLLVDVSGKDRVVQAVKFPKLPRAKRRKADAGEVEKGK